MSKNGSPVVLTPSDEELETFDWLDSFDDVVRARGSDRARTLLEELQIHAQRLGVPLSVTAQTPYVNTIGPEQQPAYPGDYIVERTLRAYMRWNAMAMVVRANKRSDGIGGHIATYASCATLYEVGFHHFFRGPDHPSGQDHIYVQGHASPGIYARAFLEGRLEAHHLENFRRELSPGGGLSSYPHPWLMPDFWQFPTVSMGIGPMSAIYHARFVRYLENRGLAEKTGSRVWAFLGDGECDEPETLAALTLASRERLENLTFVVNCNLQRLDGPVRGNGKIVQELEAVFRAAGWNVIKVLWSSDWDDVHARDQHGILAKRLGEIVDGDIQKYRVAGGAYMREHLFGKDPRLLDLVKAIPDDALGRLRLGGHDTEKVYTAYKASVDYVEGPSVILVQTTKGYGMGSAGEGLNTTHQQKKLKLDEVREFRDRFHIPVPDEQLEKIPFLRPEKGSPEHEYLLERRRALGGFLPTRKKRPMGLKEPNPAVFEEFFGGSERAASTTMVFVRILAKLMREKGLGDRIVPIIPDESRTFGLDALFRQAGIYSAVGQLYEPVDAGSLLNYREATDGQILQEGINEAGSISSFIASGTSYATLGTGTLPFYMFYSMFGPQRVGDQIWAAADARTRGFLIGGTAGRTTLNGEGLQHEDGHSHVLAQVVPNMISYDPAYAFELAVILKDGLRRMIGAEEDVFYYITVMNENYAQPAMPEGAEEGIIRGIYRFKPAPAKANKKAPARPFVHLFGSGTILNGVVRAQEVLSEKYGVDADVWSVTSYTELRRDALDADRHNLLHPLEEPKQSFLARAFADSPAKLVVAASDYMKVLPDSLAKWLPAPLVALGTDGFGRSESREALRDFFEVDTKHVVFAALSGLFRQGLVDRALVERAQQELEIDPHKKNPMRS